MEIIIFLILIIIKILTIFFTPLDSDEIMWSVMGEQILNHGRHYLFFTDQNFRGSLEAYIALPFIYIFGLNELTLRINSLIFSILTCLLIYKILIKKTLNKYLALSGVIIYFFSLPDIFIVQNKAYGSYVAMQFLMLVAFYYSEKFVEAKDNLKFVLIGLLLGFSFWANEQSIYYIFTIFVFTFFYDIKNLVFKLGRINRILYFLFFISISIPIFYILILKRMYFNLYTTFAAKLNLNYSFLNLDINFAVIILNIVILFTFFLFFNCRFKRIFSFTDSLFLKTSIYSFLVILINILFNSFARVYSTKKVEIHNSISFFDKFIVKNILGNYAYLILAIILGLLIFKLRKQKLLDFFNLKIENLLYFSFIIFPLIFLFSNLPGIAATPRYLLLWWPVIVVTLILVANIKLKYVSNLVFVFLILWFIQFSLYLKPYADAYNAHENVKQSSLQKISKMKAEGYKYCVGGYWDVGYIMFYSNLEIKCFTTKAPGIWYYRYLDIYKPTDDSKVFFINEEKPFPLIITSL